MSETITTASPDDRPVTPADTFCDYLAKQFVAKKGFAVGTVPEAESLDAVSDIVLTSHGTPFTILCLIDREAHPGRPDQGIGHPRRAKAATRGQVRRFFLPGNAQGRHPRQEI